MLYVFQISETLQNKLPKGGYFFVVSDELWFVPYDNDDDNNDDNQPDAPPEIDWDGMLKEITSSNRNKVEVLEGA